MNSKGADQPAHLNAQAGLCFCCDRFSQAHIVNLDDFIGESMIGELLNGIL